MRWESGKPRYVGQKRTTKEFLWFPRKINHEWRWLETASIVQEVDYWYTNQFGEKKLYWKDLKWVDDEKEKIK
ncbi:hypothetical protein PQE66_gp147 [Bacillus phage PBC2]|uniref:Uncharacterized protein n=1 Tax=Bacillus phage PBC2 TaxID=1675029 RepID=A0A218KC43_9CAUD|nr:hypothetical protein PQE66_gp147 [Bacillus phage PBC2]AKQ08462.1 hypothetical protein PBC2_147 [Bacillus phage PBC2]